MKYRDISSEVKNAIRNPYAWPGGYPIYTILADGSLLCPQCAHSNLGLILRNTSQENNSGWEALGAEVLWEGTEACGHCGKPLESAYGEVQS